MHEKVTDQRDLEAEREKLISEVQNALAEEIQYAIALAQSVRPEEPKAKITTSGLGSSGAHS